MSSAQNRVFRIEKFFQSELGSPSASPVPVAGQNTDQILSELAEIKKMLATGQLVQVEPGQQSVEAAQPEAESKDDPETTSSGSCEIKSEEEAEKLKRDLKEIYEAIDQTKKEILTLHKDNPTGTEISRVSDELGAIVSDTENATESILSAAEDIDGQAGNLVAALADETQNNMACDIQDQVVKIFEACNFQDLTGQRITKVITAFQFIDERVSHMMDIWGGVESFQDIEVENHFEREGDDALLNGPALEQDENVASQDDIDALFS